MYIEGRGVLILFSPLIRTNSVLRIEINQESNTNGINSLLLEGVHGRNHDVFVVDGLKTARNLRSFYAFL